MSRRRELAELRVRTCLSLHRCCVCLEQIFFGQRYHDGGPARRAHWRCVLDVSAGRKRELTAAELREIEEAERAISEARGQLYRVGKEDRGEAATRDATAMLAAATKRLEDLRARLGLSEEPRSTTF